MDFELTEDQRAITQTARQFTRDHIWDQAPQWDRDHHWPADVARAAGALGFGAIYVSEASGGVALDRLASVLVFEQMAMGCPSTAAMISIHNMAAWMIDRFGSSALKRRIMPGIVTLDQMVSYCLTEPGAGSDAASLTTKAERTSAGWRLSGAKAFISGAGDSQFYIVMARTGGAGSGAKGISAFVVEKGAEGLSFGAPEAKLGWHSQATRAVMLDGVEVAGDALLGAPGDGFKIAMQGLDGGRLSIAACSLGGAQRALQEALSYGRERRQFGQAVTDFQATQFRLADMVTELDAARLMTYRAAASVSAGKEGAAAEAAMAKRLATDTGFDVTNAALQMLGGYGYLMDYPLERILRDLRVHQILEGTNEIMRVVIARHCLKQG